MGKEIKQPVCNLLKPRMLLLRVDGSEVTTSNAKTGLLLGGENALVKKGTSATSNDVTITFNKAFAAEPVVLVTPVTTAVHCEIKTLAAGSVVIETFSVADGTTKADDADFHVLVIGTDSMGEIPA